MVKSRIVLGHNVSDRGIEIDKAKVELIAKLSPPRTVREVRSGFTAAFSKIFLKSPNLFVIF